METKQKIKRVNPQFLLDNGLLFAINHQILHPLGLAFEVYVADEGNSLFLISEGEDKDPLRVEMGKVAFGKVWDYREDDEGMLFEDKTFVDGMKKFNEFMDNFGTEKLKLRQETLGYILQPDPKIET